MEDESTRKVVFLMEDMCFYKDIIIVYSLFDFPSAFIMYSHMLMIFCLDGGETVQDVAVLLIP